VRSVLDIVIETAKEVGEEQESQALIDATEETLLFGRNLDSMGVVFLVTDLEEKVSEEYGVDITLADARAMSQRTSPFRSVNTLTNYTRSLIDEAKSEQ